MDILNYKLNIINQVLLLKDERVLTTINNILYAGLQEEQGESNHDFWLDLSDAQKEKIALSLSQIEEGKSVSGNELMSKLRQKYQAK
jgi:hypothetical protein